MRGIASLVILNYKIFLGETPKHHLREGGSIPFVASALGVHQQCSMAVRRPCDGTALFRLKCHPPFIFQNFKLTNDITKPMGKIKSAKARIFADKISEILIRCKKSYTTSINNRLTGRYLHILPAKYRLNIRDLVYFVYLHSPSDQNLRFHPF